MSRDYVVLWTRDFPTPADLGLGTDLLPWPSANKPWPQTPKERATLGYPDEPSQSLDWALVGSSPDADEIPRAAKKALAGKSVVRAFTVTNDHETATDLAAAGAGVCFDEDHDVLFPTKRDQGANASEAARRLAAARLWASLHRRPSTACDKLVEAAAKNDATAIAVLRAWAPDPLARPNLGVRHMGHDRTLCDLVFEAAKKKPAGLAALIDVLQAHGYYPAARRPEFAALAKAAGADVAHFVRQAERDAAERLRWFKVEEPLD